MTDILPERIECDVLVAGTGAAGFATAITARLLGFDVVMVEKAPRFGGTTARSGGIPWVPGNRFTPDGDAETARGYLRLELGNRYDPALIDAYLESGPQAIDFLVEHGAAAFKPLDPFPDYHSEVAGASMGGRGLRPLPYDGRRLGKRFADIEWPIGETMLFGRMTINGEHMPHYYAVARSIKSFAFVTRRMARYVADRLAGYPRGTELTSGNALIARFAEKAFALGIPIQLSTELADLTRDGERVTGAVVKQGGRHTTIVARRGVALATGGFSRHPALREEHFPDGAAGAQSWSLTTPGVTGDAAALAGAAGGDLDADKAQAATWLPMSRVPDGHGGFNLFPHLVDRNKPGFITVNRKAQRFVSESVSYQDFVPPIIDTLAEAGGHEVYMIFDHRALRTYGAGPVRPYPVPIGKWLRNGYLVRGATLAELAGKLGLDGAALTDTVTRFNTHAARGDDPEFHRGSTRYQQAMGDYTHKPSPSLGPLDQAPYYAVRLMPGDIGTSIGLRADADGRVLRGDGTAIPGLYTAGNDMANPTAGVYPGPGVTLGPAITFGWRAARHMAADQATSNPTQAMLETVR